MKRIRCIILLAAFSCHPERSSEPVFPPEPAPENAPLVFEGRVPLDEDVYLYIEVFMVPATERGEGSYTLREFLEEDASYTPLSSFKGNYSSLYGNNPGERVVQFLQSAREKGLKRRYLKAGFQGNYTDTQIQMIREEVFRKTDLTVRLQETNKLIVLDDNLQPVTLEGQFNLNRRTSGLFTVEGYFRHTGDTADFAEMNTGERWAVAKVGDYHKAIRQYYQLATDKFEVTYLKGVGYTIRHTDKEGKEIQALVFKKILQMTSSPIPPPGYQQPPQ